MSLDQLFPFKIDMNTEHAELEFIKSGIETLVAKIYEVIDTHAKVEIERQKNKLNEVTGLNLTEMDSNETVLKVGSFYDGTKIIYPDEFDFILLFGTFKMPKDEIAHHKFGFGSLIIYGKIEKILSQKDISQDLYYIKHETESSIIFDSFVSHNGPALKIKFNFCKQGSSSKEIYVDLVPAFKILDEFIDSKIERMCSLPEFRKAIVDQGSFLITRYFISFTETEVEFMNNQLSSDHLKAYRLLKYLINGNNDGEKLRNYCANKDFDNIHISTYRIKTCMIFHHYSCKTGDGSVVKCICDVLCDLYDAWKDRRWRNLVAGLDMREHYGGGYGCYMRSLRIRAKAGELLVSMLKHFTFLGSTIDYESKYIVEPWAVSVFREAEVKTVMKDILDNIEVIYSREYNNMVRVLE